MNKTKKITQGAMMLAILGALVLIDRITAYWFTELVVLVAPIVIILYSSMYSVKDGLLLSVGMMIICFLLGNFNISYLIFVPVGIVTGIAYSIGISKKLNKSSLLFIAILSYVVCELIVSFVVYPLLGFPLATQLEEITSVFKQMSQNGFMNIESSFNNIGVDFSKILVIMFIISTILTGAMEGVIIHILSIFMLRRFKIKNIENTNIMNIKPNPVIAYISFLSLFSLFLNNFISNDTVKYASIVLSLLGMIVLIFYGYIYLTIYGKLAYNKNIGTIVVILSFFVPAVLIGIVIIGFLYGAGPLRKKLEDMVNNKNE